MRAYVVMLAVACGLQCTGEPTYRGVGEIVEVDDATGTIAIVHEGISGVAEPGSMRGQVSSLDLLRRVSSRMRVSFAVKTTADGFEFTELAPIDAGRPGMHDHTPHHGGVVTMIGMLHLEAVADADGSVRLYLSDVWRVPLPPASVAGTVTITRRGRKRASSLAVAGDHLTASGPPGGEGEVHAHFELVREGQALEANFVLPLEAARAGAAGVPAEGCVPEPADAGDSAPRCTLRFSRPVSAVAASARGSIALIAAIDSGVSVWKLPAVRFEFGLRPPPPLQLPEGEGPHPEAVNAIVVRSDGAEAIVASEGRLLRYATETGQLLAELPSAGAVVRAVAWSPDGSSILVTTFYQPFARLLRAQDGRELQRFPVEREGAGVAFRDDGEVVAIGSETGFVVLADPRTGAQLGVLEAGRRAITGLGFVDKQLISAGEDGLVRIWGSEGSHSQREYTLGAPATCLVVMPGGARFAVGAQDGAVRVFDVEKDVPPRTLHAPHKVISAVAWGGPLLLVADGSGQVSVWASGS